MKLFIAGHQGMVGGALVRRFQRESGVTLLLRSRRELDLTSQTAVDAFYAAEKPDVAIIAAAKVGGIHANNTYPAEFLFDPHDNTAREYRKMMDEDIEETEAFLRQILFD